MKVMEAHCDNVTMNTKMTTSSVWNEMYMFRSLIHDKDISNDFHEEETEETSSLNDTMSHDGYVQSECQSDNEVTCLHNNIILVHVTVKLNGQLFACGVSILDMNQVNHKDASNCIISSTDMVPMMVDSVFVHQVCLCIPSIILNYSQSKYDSNDLNIIIEMRTNGTLEVQVGCQQGCILSEIQPLSNLNISNNSEDGRNLSSLQLSLMRTNLPISWPSTNDFK